MSSHCLIFSSDHGGGGGLNRRFLCDALLAVAPRELGADHLDTRNHTTISISMAHHLLSIQQVEWGDPRVVFIQYSCRHRAPDPTAFFFLFLSLRHVLATLTYMCALLKEVLAQR